MSPPSPLPALPDALLEGAMAAAIEAAKVRHALSDGEARWSPGQPLKLLLAGYQGVRNTGADVRVAEIVRQLRAIVGDERLELTVLTADPRLSAGYFPGARQVRFPDLFPPFLFREVAAHHGVVACEGSMFKSKFANALSVFLAGALGLAAAGNKLALGYGAEAGEMDPLLQGLVSRWCKDALVIVRNEASGELLRQLGVPTAPGTDTAWTFEPAPAEAARALLRRAGWDGRAPILAVCPINPFWWPVRPRLGRALLDALRGESDARRYRGVYYHDYPEAAEQKHARYLDALAAACGRFAEERGAHLVLVGMERLDRRAADELAARLGRPVPRFISDEYDMFELVAILREARWLVSSRYHALVCSAAAGVPALGVSMDERIENLLVGRGQAALCHPVEAVDLEERIAEGLRRLELEREEVAAGTLGAIPRELEALGRMGIRFEEELLRRYPDFPRRDAPREWRRYLPALSPRLEALLG